MAYIKSEDRNQISFIPDSIDMFIDEDNYVRVLDAFVEELNFDNLGFKFVESNRVGAPSYNPRTMLKLYLYSYLEGVRSTRKIERLTHINLEAMWLTSKLHPDHKTIANFRKDNHAALLKTFEAFNFVFNDLDMFGKDLVVLDGTKIRGSNSKDKSYTKRKLYDLRKYAKEQLDTYIAELNANDKLDDSAEKERKKKEILTHVSKVKKKLVKYDNLSEKMRINKAEQISITDPDTKRMRSSTGHSVVGYNVQVCVDAKNKLPVAFEVTNKCNDFGQLSKLTIKTKRFFEQTIDGSNVLKMKVIADTGYYEAEEMIKCKEANIETYISKRNGSSNKEKGFRKDDFTFDIDMDLYYCPEGYTLTNRSKPESVRKRYYNPTACNVCSKKSRCFSRKREKYRIIENHPIHEKIYREVDQRVNDNKHLMRQRKAIVEHPFGTIKEAMNADHFLMRRMENVTTEMALSLCAYNFKRVFNELKRENRTWDMIKSRR